MKKLLIAVLFLTLSSFASAEPQKTEAAGVAGAPGAAAAVDHPAKMEKVAKKGHHVTKEMRATAKGECIQEKPELEKNKKALKKCIHQKLQATK